MTTRQRMKTDVRVIKRDTVEKVNADGESVTRARCVMKSDDRVRLTVDADTAEDIDRLGLYMGRSFTLTLPEDQTSLEEHSTGADLSDEGGPAPLEERDAYD